MFKIMVKTIITIQKILEINKLKSMYVSYIVCEGNALPPKCECIQLLFTTNAK